MEDPTVTAAAPRRTPALAVSIGAGAATVTGGVLAKAGLLDWERPLFDLLNRRVPDEIAPSVWLPMQFGAGATPLVVGAVMWRSGHKRSAEGVVASGVAAWLAAKAVKRATGRMRPADHLVDVRHRVGTARHGLGYPSGHAAVAAAIATSLGPDVGRLTRVTAWTTTALVAWSRIYVGAHLPLDVLGGMTLGISLGTLYRGLRPVP